jgi:hypothetical protein
LAIARSTGFSKSYVYALFADPDGTQEAKRRTRYEGSCIDCGGRTYNGGSASGPPKRCRRCRKRYEEEATFWTRERIVESIQRWADVHGGVPPLATEWKVRGAYWPCTKTVQIRFGLWSTAIQAAGFEAPLVGKYGRDGEDDDLCLQIMAEHDDGLKISALANRYEVSATAIAYRISKARKRAERAV